MAMQPFHPVGIVGYGGYVPRYRIAAAEIGRVWGAGKGGLPVQEKAVAGPDEDTVTMAIEAGRNALRRAAISPAQLGAVWVGSESHPYAVKPSGTLVAEALGTGPQVSAADWEFACKAGTEALTAAIALVSAQMQRYALAIGADTAQGRPGDALEYTASASAAALIVGPQDEALATFEALTSYVSDTPDFFRRADRPYPVHGSRFTGEPAYFAHITAATQQLLGDIDAEPGDFDYVIFHQPNARFPQVAAKKLGFTDAQLTPGLLAPQIGNSYSAAALLGLCATLDVAQPGQRILVTSYGSGAGADSFALRVTERLPEARERAPLVERYLARRELVDYALYARWRGKIAM